MEIYSHWYPYALNTLGISSLLTGILVFLFGVSVFIIRKMAFNAFALFILTTALSGWLISFAFMYFSTTKNLAFYWGTLGFYFVPLLSPIVYFLCVSALDKVYLRRVTVFILFCLGYFFVFSQLVFNLLFSDMIRYSWGYFPKFNTTFTLFFLGFLFCTMLLCFRELWNDYLHSKAPQKSYYKYLAVAYVIGYLSVLDFLPGFEINSYPVGFVFILLFIVALIPIDYYYEFSKIKVTSIASTIIETMGDSLLVCDENGIIRIANKRGTNLLLKRCSNLVGMPINEVIIDTSPRPIVDFFKFLKREMNLENLEIQLDEGSIKKHINLTFTIIKTNVILEGWIIVLRDVTKQHQDLTQIAYMANYDTLTGAYNRNRFEEEIELSVNQNRRLKTTSAIAIFNIEHLKEVNDSFGYFYGDQVLKTFHQLLKEQIRTTDMLFRLGADEFAILFNNISYASIEKLLEKIFKHLKNSPLKLQKQHYIIKAHAGVALFPVEGCSGHDIGIKADLALIQCKEERTKRFHIYQEEDNLNGAYKSNIMILNQLEIAIKNNSFVFLYQPIVDLRSNEILKYEMLIRLRENNTLISPDAFLPIAQRYDLMPEIDELVIKKTIEILETDKKTHLACNISSHALNNKNLLAYLTEKLSNNDWIAKRITLEITETDAIANIDNSLNFINHCKALGLKFAIDDFGVGHSSYSYLKHLPIDYLKIDGSFIKNIDKNKVDEHLVKSMVTLAKALKIKIIAEYIKSEAIANLVKDLEVHYGQGYYFSKPLEFIKKS